MTMTRKELRELREQYKAAANYIQQHCKKAALRGESQKTLTMTGFSSYIINELKHELEDNMFTVIVSDQKITISGW